MSRNGSANILIGIAIAVITAGLTAYIVYKAFAPVPEPPPPPPVMAGPIEIDGELGCLPSKRGTEECAIGLRGDDGEYYGLRDSGNRFNLGLRSTAQMVHVFGDLSPGSPDFLKLYDAAGIIDIHSFIQLQAKFADKVVYTADQSVDVEPLKQDCARRGGTFNNCGSPCTTDAEVCVEVCAFTCELSSPTTLVPPVGLDPRCQMNAEGRGLCRGSFRAVQFNQQSGECEIIAVNGCSAFSPFSYRNYQSDQDQNATLKLCRQICEAPATR